VVESGYRASALMPPLRKKEEGRKAKQRLCLIPLNKAPFQFHTVLILNTYIFLKRQRSLHNEEERIGI